MSHSFIVVFVLFACLSIATPAIFPPDHDANLDWNIRIETINKRGEDLFKQLFHKFDNLNNKVQILASFSTWSESPLYVDSLNSILFSSPADRNLYRYNLYTKETTLFIENAGEFGGIYGRDIPLDQCLECGPNGMTIGINGIQDYVILNQLALGRVIAFDPNNINEDEIIIIADNYHGTELNSPNDITITSDGASIYFTDPTFGLQKDGDIGFTNSFARSKLGFSGVYRVDSADILQGKNKAILVIDNMEGPNGLAVTDDNQYLIVSNTGDEFGWRPYWNIYKISDCENNDRYELYKTIYFNMAIWSWNSWKVGAPLADGMVVYNDEILLAICPNGICLIDLIDFTMVGRIAIDHLISNIHIHNKWIYVTGENNLWRIKLTAH